MTLDPNLEQMLAAMRVGAAPVEAVTPETARARYAAALPFLHPADRLPAVGEVLDIDADGVPARVYRPEGAGVRPTIVFFHGGGWVMGDVDSYDHTARRIAREVDAVVVSVGYALAPERPFPQGLEDCLRATRWVVAHRTELGGSHSVAVAGDSAGGNFSAVVAQALRDQISAQLLIYPATDLGGDYPSRTENGKGYGMDAEQLDWCARQYLGGDQDAAAADLADPRLSPIHGDLAGLPPALVLTAQYDPLRDEGEAYARAMQEAGSQAELITEAGLVHGYFEMEILSPVADARISAGLARFKELLPR